MKYILLIQYDAAPTPYSPDRWARLSEAEQKALYTDYGAINETPGVSPTLRLQPAEAATTVRVEDGETLLTDGPFVAIEEALGGYLLYEADDLDAAIELASRIPAVRWRCVRSWSGHSRDKPGRCDEHRHPKGE